MINGKDRIRRTFARLREERKKGLITYVTAGYPDAGTTLEILKILADEGSDIIELGVPFSDPVADGPVIQRASHRALSGGLTLQDIFAITQKLRMYTDVPILLMSYYNPIYRTGLEKFIYQAMRSGVDGLIVPDLPVEEDEPLRTQTRKAGLSLIPLAAPTSTEQRLIKIAERADSFIYCVSVTGVTGSRKEINTDLKTFTDTIKKYSPLPLALGFGIADPETASKAAAHSDAVVVGSAIVNAIEGDGGVAGIKQRIGKIIRGIKEGIGKPDSK